MHHLKAVFAFILLQHNRAFEFMQHHYLSPKYIIGNKRNTLTFVGESYPRVDAVGCVSRAQQNKIQLHQCQIQSPYALCHPHWATHSTFTCTEILQVHSTWAAKSKKSTSSCKQCLTGDLGYNNPTRSTWRQQSFFWWSQQCGSTRCISAVSIQSLPSPMAVCWKLHPPTTSVDRIVLWLLCLFGLSNYGEEKSSC